MVVYGEGTYRCAEHGVVVPGLRPAAQLRERALGAASARACGAASSSRCPSREDAAAAAGERLRDHASATRRSWRSCSVEAYGFEACALRYLNVYGPRQALGNPYTGVAAIFSARVLGGRPPRVFEDGGQIRDLVHVSDVVARDDAPRWTRRARRGRAFNVGTGRRDHGSPSWPRGSSRAARVPSLEPEITGEFRAGDIRHCFADPDAGARAARLRGEGDARATACRSWPSGSRPERPERGDEAVAELRARGLVTSRLLSRVTSPERVTRARRPGRRGRRRKRWRSRAPSRWPQRPRRQVQAYVAGAGWAAARAGRPPWGSRKARSRAIPARSSSSFGRPAWSTIQVSIATPRAVATAAGLATAGESRRSRRW